MAAICTGCDISHVQCVRKTETEILQFYVEHGVYRRIRVCGNPKCGNILNLNEASSFMFRCGRRYSPASKAKKVKCRFAESAKKGTFFGNAKVSLSEMFYFVATVLIIPVPRTEYLKKNFSFSTATISAWYLFCREVFYNHVSNQNEKLGGPGHIVEIEEAKFGKHKYNHGRPGQWVYGGIDRENGRTFLIPVRHRNKETLLDIIKSEILPGTTIISDCWKIYDVLYDEGYIYETVNLSKKFIDRQTFAAHTNTIKQQGQSVRNEVPKYGRSSHLVGYLAEFLFKSKYRDLNSRVHYFWLAVAEMYPPKE